MERTARYKKITGQTIANYDAMWKKIIDAKPVRNNSIPGAFVKWDNTPRHGDRGQVNDIFNSSCRRRWCEFFQRD